MVDGGPALRESSRGQGSLGHTLCTEEFSRYVKRFASNNNNLLTIE